MSAADDNADYRRGAQILSVGIASTGLLTLAFFALAGHALTKEQYGPVAALWALLFIMMSVFYRPVEQLLSRTIADRIARGHDGGHDLRLPLILQAGFAAAFLAVALAARSPIEQRLLGGSGALFTILIAAAVAYAASYFARGYFAGHRWFGLYGGLVLFESLARVCFPLAALIGIVSGQTLVAAGILAAPLASLVVIPWAIARHHRQATATALNPNRPRTPRSSATGFAVGVAMIQLGEQALLNVAVLLISGAAIQGLVFNALLIARAPLQLFQVIQTSLLPHLAGLAATDGRAAFERAVRQTALAIAGFAALITAGLLLLGPWAMETVFAAPQGAYDRSLALVGVGMGFHLVAGTFTQAALARGRAAQAAASWILAAAIFVAAIAGKAIADPLLCTEVAYCGATVVLCIMLLAVDRYADQRPARSTNRPVI